MPWYKDRDFPEIKMERYNAPPEIIAVIENPEQIKRAIDEYNSLEEDLNYAENDLEEKNKLYTFSICNLAKICSR